MPGFKQVVLGVAAAAAIACAPVAPAAAGGHGGHGFGHLHSWGLGRGLVGAVVGLATLPIVIAAAALSATDLETPYQSSGYDGPRGYAPPPAYYAAPQTYAAPPAYYAPQTYNAAPRAYYSRAPVYTAVPRAYPAPRAYYAPRLYGGRAEYRPGGYAYPHR
jgi:hypothetical protein